MKHAALPVMESRSSSNSYGNKKARLAEDTADSGRKGEKTVKKRTTAADLDYRLSRLDEAINLGGAPDEYLGELGQERDLLEMELDELKAYDQIIESILQEGAA